ncbi:hypothetical protein V9K92_01105 [Phyllobacterium sp. CCNWLW109]|uniref:hypothetical protein n=1 Tax=Phyllobacterium sp. CCNWLW109 TaxID=3127479 RepID=UPI0030768EC5
MTSELKSADKTIATAIIELVSQMRVLWERRGEWESYNDLMELGRTGSALIRVCGVHAMTQANGTAYINMPPTADTMPADATQSDLYRILMRGGKQEGSDGWISGGGGVSACSSTPLFLRNPSLKSFGALFPTPLHS